jgi:D-alanyl-D-alanine carboxypeptidase/D-alanyl-D-alanine-endopeptidase (penicillin-binding protein 4)
VIIERQGFPFMGRAAHLGHSVSPTVQSRNGARAAWPLALIALLLAFAVAAPAVAGPSPVGLESRLERALEVPGVSPAWTAAFAIDLATGGAVYAANTTLSLRPASNQKLTVAVAALDALGPNFRMETQVLGEGALEVDIWDGDLVLKGFGDPTLERGDLAAMARQIRNAGIARVTGRVRADESFFDTRRTAPGWKSSFYKEEAPPLSALVVDDGRVRGRVVDDPALAAARAFREALEQAGVEVARGARVAPASPDAVPLAGVLSQRLALVVREMNRESDNFAAEALLKALGAHELGRGTSAAGARVVRRELQERGVPLAGVRIVDGSGLSRGDRLTAEALAALLVSAWSDPRIGPAFVDSLAVAGVNGTLEDRMERPPARGLVRAKTGTTSLASSLSGFVGDRYAFVVLMNGNPIPWYWARRGQDSFAQLLAGT